jgi:iron complex transport system substrate-binding protein
MQTRRLVALAAALGLALTPAACSRRAAPAPTAGGQRVISLAPSLTEIVCAIGAGDLLVGRTSACDYPPGVVSRVPVVGGFGAPSLELLAAARPTLILDVSLEDETLGQKIAGLGLRRERIACSTLDDIPSAMATVGRLVGREAEALRAAERMRAGIAALRARAGGDARRPKVLVEIWCDPVTTVGRRSFLSELIRLAGGANVGDEVDKDYFQVSSEWVVSKAPDVILCLYMSRDGSARRTVRSRDGWQSIPAVRNDRICDDFDNNMILRPGPRILDSVEALRRCMAGPSAATTKPPAGEPAGPERSAAP